MANNWTSVVGGRLLGSGGLARALLVAVALLVGSLFAGSSPAWAATFTVNSTADTDDGACTAGAGGCTLREAIRASNAAAGADSIVFAVGSGTPTILVGSSGLGALPEILDLVTIDGGTGGATRVQLNGASAGAGRDGLMIEAGSTTIRSLVINRFSGRGILIFGGEDATDPKRGNNVVENCIIGTDGSSTAGIGNGTDGIVVFRSPGNRIGGTAAAMKNVISGNGQHGVQLNGFEATGNSVQMNFIGTNVAGTAKLGNGGNGVLINNTGFNTVSENVISGNAVDGVLLFGAAATQNTVWGNFIGVDANGETALANGGLGVDLFQAPNNRVGGTNTTDLNVISGNGKHGVGVFTAADNRILGNHIGTGFSGVSRVGNGMSGVFVQNAPRTIIGGDEVAARNIISANVADGIGVFGASTTQTRIRFNHIGANKDGIGDLGNGQSGIYVNSGATASTIGGSGQGNLIAFNGARGVAVSSGTGHMVVGNRLHSNAQLGIDLGLNGVTANDAGDGDTGPNNFQNYPVITSATTASGTTTIQGTFNSAASRTYRLDIFSNPSCDPSGNGEGELFIASRSETTNASGNVTLNFPLLAAEAVGRFITTTATDPDGNTSEFSLCRQVTAGGGSGNGTVTVTRVGTGNGTVTSSPGGINCPTDCTEAYTIGTPITLTATPVAGSTFGGWTGDCTPNGSTCTRTVQGGEQITATFNSPAPGLGQLQVAKAGNGSGTVTSSPAGINCGADCTEDYVIGTVVTLTATPSAGSVFAGFSGPCTPNGLNTCSRTIQGGEVVTATFTLSGGGGCGSAPVVDITVPKKSEFKLNRKDRTTTFTATYRRGGSCTLTLAQWDFHDGTTQDVSLTGTQTTVTHTFPSKGRFAVTFTVIDSEGRERFDVVFVTVKK